MVPANNKFNLSFLREAHLSYRKSDEDNRSLFHHSSDDVFRIIDLIERVYLAQEQKQLEYVAAAREWAAGRRDFKTDRLFGLIKTIEEKSILEHLTGKYKDGRHDGMVKKSDIEWARDDTGKYICQEYFKTRIGKLCKFSWANKKPGDHLWHGENELNCFSNATVFGQNLVAASAHDLFRFIFYKMQDLANLERRLRQLPGEGVSLGGIDQDLIVAMPMLLHYLLHADFSDFHRYMLGADIDIF